jgi:hypothetical protein
VIPSAEKLRQLAADYRSMESMFFASPAPFEAMIDRLKGLETEINAA